jgi:SAM-dependent methyltransferase
MQGRSGPFSPGAPHESGRIALFRKVPDGISRRLSALRHRFRVGVNRVESYVFDLRHGTDTAGKTPVKNLDDVVGTNLDHGTGYQPLNGSHFRKVMNSLPIPSGSVFVDVGSGKGKALLIAAEYGTVARAVGVEFSGGLCAAARRNIGRYRRHRDIAGKIEVRHQDALLYDIEPDQNIFLLFNPFDRELLSSFADKIAASVRQRPRRFWLIYVNPKDSEVLDGHPGFALEKLHRFYGPGRNIAVYGGGSRPR